eukprot:jgi/Chrzof1/4221/Cz14g03180.t1
MEAYLVTCVQNSLALYLNDNAKFLCERLVATYPREQHKYLLATCYKQCNQAYRAYYLLQGHQSPQSRYLFALCCMELSKFQEADAALLRDGEEQVPNGAAGLYLLGRICRLTNRQAKAAEYYAKALRLDPLLWTAYEELCALGFDDLAADVCDPSPPIMEQPATGSGIMSPGVAGTFSAMSIDGHPQPAAATAATAAPGAAPMSCSQPTADRPPEWTSTSALFGPLSFTPQALSFVTPSPHATTAAPPDVPVKGQGPAGFPGFAAVPPQQPAGSRTPTLGKTRGGEEGGTRVRKLSKATGRLFTDSSPANLRRSARLAAAHTNGDIITPPAPNRGHGYQHLHQKQQHAQQPQHPHHNGHSVDDDSMQPSTSSAPSYSLFGKQSWQPSTASQHLGQDVHAQVSSILSPLKAAIRHLSQFRCQQALAELQRLPQQQQQTAWVLCCIGRARFEMVDYPGAAAAFELARKCDPYRVEGMEIYSTVLWHLKKEVELAHLAHECIQLDRLSPSAWCVMGNCFSLQREHESAIKFFQRALQLDPSMAYAATLAGHEYLAGESFEEAMMAYRTALRADGRHYNAFYGIGQIFLRQEKYDMALQHFQAASSINTTSSVLRCYCGMALHKMGRLAEALRLLQEAISSDARNPLARYEKASVLTSMDRCQEALREFEALRDIAPRESSVYFQMGRLHKRLGNVDDALSCYDAALDLQPSSADAALIKAAIDKVHVADDDEDEEL